MENIQGIEGIDKDELFENFKLFLSQKSKQNPKQQQNPKTKPSEPPESFRKMEENTQSNSNNIEDNLHSFPDVDKEENLSQPYDKKNPNTLDEEPSNPKPAQNFDDIPIKSKYIQNFDEMPIQPKNVQNFDEMPIQPKKVNFDLLVEQEIAKGGYESNNINNFSEKPKFEYKPRNKPNDKLNYFGKQLENKQHRYYSDNFKPKKQKKEKPANSSLLKGSDLNSNFDDIPLPSATSKQPASKKKRVAPVVSDERANKFFPTKPVTATNISTYNNKVNQNKKVISSTVNSDINKSDEIYMMNKKNDTKKPNNIPNQETDANKYMEEINEYSPEKLYEYSGGSKRSEKEIENLDVDEEYNSDNSLENKYRDYLKDIEATKTVDVAPKNPNPNPKQDPIQAQLFIEQIPPEYLVQEEERDGFHIYDDKYLLSEVANKVNPQPIEQKKKGLNSSSLKQGNPERNKKILNKNSLGLNNQPAETKKNTTELFGGEVPDVVALKIQELNKNIELVKEENEKVTELKNQYEMLTKKLKEEIDDYNIKKENDKNEFEKYKANELKKIERERKVQLRNRQALQSGASKKDREEIESLKDQISKLQEEMKMKDQRNKLAMDRLKRQLEDLNKKNESLQNEIKMLEEQRIKGMTNKSKASSTTLSSKNSNFEMKQNKSNKNLGVKKPSNLSSPSASNLQYKTQSQIITEGHIPNNTKNDISLTKNEPKKMIKVHTKQKNKMNNFQSGYGSSSKTNIIPKNFSSADHNKFYEDENEEKEEEENADKNQENSLNEEDLASEDNKKGQDDFLPKQNEKDSFQMVFPPEYHNNTSLSNNRLIKQDITPDGTIIKTYENKRKEVFFTSGLKKEVFPDGYQVSYFNNNDVKQLFPDGKEVYRFAENGTVQTKLPNGLLVFLFPNGQLEKNFPDGTKIIIYPDGTIRNVYPDKYEEIFFDDGSLQKIFQNGIITVEYPDGVKDTILPDGTKKREFPDGKVTQVNPDGTNENYFKSQEM